MCILTADVHKVLCLFYDKLLEYIDTEQHGVKCDITIDDIKLLLNHYELQCWYNDYIRNLVLEEGDTVEDCDRVSFSLGVIG